MAQLGDGLNQAVQKAFTRPIPKSAPAQMRYLVKQLKSTEAAAAALGITQRTVERYVKDQIKMELDRRGAELLFQVLTEREEKNSVAIASNESFSDWTKTFTGPRLCAAIVDRLTFGGNIIETGTESYRLATTRARAKQQALG
ncbi:ATP-binding protein [Streptomyces sp. NPDC059496]|uniref:ATP-binding protein n=1 Tax=Streptomyces sp. NPDC059496 TaxID=3346851 RepID=UPI0036B78D77